MSKTTTFKGLILATAAAGFFANSAFTYAEDATAPLPGSAESKTHCQAVNSCKGRGDCKGENGCKGKNDCKGKGFLDLTMKECDNLVVKMAVDASNAAAAPGLAEMAAPAGN